MPVNCAHQSFLMTLLFCFICSITDSSVEPLRAHLGELDNAIKDQLDLIAAVKSNVLKNDDKVNKMLGSITKS